MFVLSAMWPKLDVRLGTVLDLDFLPMVAIAQPGVLKPLR